MESLDYDYKVHITPNAGDDALRVKFFTGPIQDMQATEEHGRPIFKDVEWIDIRLPGNRGDVVIRPIRPEDLTRFPRHYAAFKQRIAGQAASEVGTLLSAWGYKEMTPARIEELKYFNIYTVENLAALSDSVGQQIMGFNTLKRAAQLYLENSKATAPLLRLQAQLEAALQKINEQGNEIARLSAQQQGLPAPATFDMAAPMRQAAKEIVEGAALEEKKVVKKSKTKKRGRPARITQIE